MCVSSDTAWKLGKGAESAAASGGQKPALWAVEEAGGEPKWLAAANASGCIAPSIRIWIGFEKPCPKLSRIHNFLSDLIQILGL